jgi:septum formation protein
MDSNGMIILASASPRREELLRNAGIPHCVQATGIPEFPLPGEAPRVFAERLAREKALAVSREYPHDWVLGADTIVAVDDHILGKPIDEPDATRMLRLLSGRTHKVTTGVCLIGPSVQDVRSETTLVSMAALTDDDIREYIATGEPMDKAGAYAIQGRASRWIPRIEGDYANVVGLPVALVYRMLRQHGGR